MYKFALALTVLTATSSAVATTVLTEQNIARLEAALPELAAIEQDNPQGLTKLRLKKHCDWQQHASDLRQQEQGKAYVAEVDQVLAKHQLTAPLFLELTAKGSWPLLQSLQPVQQLTRQSLPFLPEPQRRIAEQKIQQTEQMQQAIEPCLTAADKTALQHHKQRLLKLATSLPGAAF
ncbi:hypothetical protein [Alishewanella jeotgali]|uniref:Chorismate mutase n=1 Tax=Alishewanella jeotgali KCTC 22429 TaxID=1129374 RepID=H3ZAT4_9ALTE|nr:hypothetical protein [Alishewanella jeotgali]EHR42048.1 hypothetical protein AJE_02186 [Alishewanella jeotgali KCTC 22429]